MNTVQANILAAVEWLVSDCQPQDSLVFAFSGHGTLDDSNAMGQDGILPSDFEEVSQSLHKLRAANGSLNPQSSLVAVRPLIILQHQDGLKAARMKSCLCTECTVLSCI